MKQVELVKANAEDKDELHRMKVDSFMLNYGIYNDDIVMWISPIFILPEFKDLKLREAALTRLFEMWDNKTTWKLSTIKQEARNRHFYEKLGFELLDWEEHINDRMDLVMYERRGQK